MPLENLQKDGMTPKKARASRRRKAQAQEQKDKGDVRIRDFDIAHGACRVCRKRLMQSVHEILPKSLGGVASMANSISVCGDGTRGCHGFLQRHEIDPVDGTADVNANELMAWKVKSEAAARWLGVPQGAVVVR